MGQLVTRQNLNPGPPWYFPDAHYSWEARQWHYEWPSKEFPSSVAIHNDDLSENRQLKIEIRKWIESNITGTVILDEIDKRYRVYFGKTNDWDMSYERSNKWLAFYFENKEDALMFRLRFSDYVREITDLHPTAGDIYEKTSYYQED